MAWARLATTSAVLLASMALDARQVATGGPAAMPAASRSAALRARGLDLGYNLDHRRSPRRVSAAIAADPDESRGVPSRRRDRVDHAALRARRDHGRRLSRSGARERSARAAARRTSIAQASTTYLEHAEKISRAAAASDHPDDADAHYQRRRRVRLRGVVHRDGRRPRGRQPRPGATRVRRARTRARARPSRKDAGLDRRALSLRGRPSCRCRCGSSRISPASAAAASAGSSSSRTRPRIRATSSRTRSSRSSCCTTAKTRYDDALEVIRRTAGGVSAQPTVVARSRRHRAACGTAGRARARRSKTGLARLARDPRPRAAGEEARWRYTYGAALVALHDVEPAERELSAALPGRDARLGSRPRAQASSASSPDLAGDRARALDEYRQADRLCRSDQDIGVRGRDPARLLKHAVSVGGRHDLRLTATQSHVARHRRSPIARLRDVARWTRASVDAGRHATTLDARLRRRHAARRLSHGIRRDPRSEAERRTGALRLRVRDLRGLGVDSAVALRQQRRHAGRRRRRRHDRRRQGRAGAVARQPARAGVRHGAERTRCDDREGRCAGR